MFNLVINKISQISRVASLAPTIIAKLYVIWWSLWMALRHRLGIKQEKPGKFELRYKGKDFRFYSSYSTDLSVIDEVFIQGQYEIPEDFLPETIFDLGSNTGVTVKFFELKFPQSSIYAFEPDANVFRSLERNFRNSSHIKLFNLAISDLDQDMEFYIHPKSSIVSSVMPRFPEQEKIKVKGRSLQSITDELGLGEIDLVKFDVEGAEKAIFSSFDTGRIRMLVGELHTDLSGMSLEEFKGLFPSHEVKSEQISPYRYTIVAERKI